MNTPSIIKNNRLTDPIQVITGQMTHGVEERIAAASLATIAAVRDLQTIIVVRPRPAAARHSLGMQDCKRIAESRNPVCLWTF
jgi:hypothetical protein